MYVYIQPIHLYMYRCWHVLPRLTILYHWHMVRSRLCKLPLSLPLSHTHTHTHARTHARTHTHTHTHTCTHEDLSMTYEHFVKHIILISIILCTHTHKHYYNLIMCVNITHQHNISWNEDDDLASGWRPPISSNEIFITSNCNPLSISWGQRQHLQQ